MPTLGFWGGKRIKITALGGVNAVGEKNCVLLTCGNDGVLFDCGQRIPKNGDDYDIYPDLSGLPEVNLRGVLVSHGHLDHIGGLVALFKRNPTTPIVSSSFTLRVIAHHLLKEQQGVLSAWDKQEELSLGPFRIKRFPVLHSIPGSSGFLVSVDGKNIVYTGDIKTPGASFPPSSEEKYEIYTNALSEIGGMGIDALIQDSTNIREFGYAGIEERVYASLRRAIQANPSVRVFVSLISSNVARARSIIKIARVNTRKVYVAGSSLKSFFHIAGIDGWHSLDAGSCRFMPDDAVVIVSGSQGEGMGANHRGVENSEDDKQQASFLAALAMGELDIPLNIGRADTLVISSDTIPLPHIERNFSEMMTVLAGMFGKIYVPPDAHWFEKGGAEVRRDTTLHLSGHGKQDDIRDILALTRPKLLIPFHADRARREVMANFAEQKLGIKSLMLETGKSETL